MYACVDVTFLCSLKVTYLLHQMGDYFRTLLTHEHILIFNSSRVWDAVMSKDQTRSIIFEQNEWLLARLNAYKLIDNALFIGTITDAVHASLKASIDTRECKTFDEYSMYIALPPIEPIRVTKRKGNDNVRKAEPYKKFIQSECLTLKDIEEFKNTICIQFGDEADSIEKQAYMDRGIFLERSTIALMQEAFPGVKEDQHLQKRFVRKRPVLRALPNIIDASIGTTTGVSASMGVSTSISIDLSHPCYDMLAKTNDAFCMLNGRFDAVRGNTVFEIKNRIANFHILPREKIQLCIYIMMGNFTEGYLVERCNNKLSYTKITRSEAEQEWNVFADALYTLCSDIYQNPTKLMAAQL